MDRKILAWALYDFANSSYSAVIASVIFPVYYATVIVGNVDGLGDLWWGRAISLSMFLVAASSPFIGGIADISGRRKSFLIVYTIGAIGAVLLLTTLKTGMVIYGFVIIVIANMCVEGGFVFYNAYLPIITKREHIGRVSALGYGVGYAGSIISLLIALHFLGTNQVSAAWVQVAVIFGLFSLPLFLLMPSDTREKTIIHSAVKGLKQTIHSIKGLIRIKNSRLFLLSYFLYTDGVNTVIVFSSIFAVTTLGFERKEVVLLFLLVQLCALLGSFIVAFFIEKWGPKRVVQISLFAWITVTVVAFFVQTKGGFFIIAALAGSVLGTIQAASRTLFTFFIPEDKEAEFFGVYSTVGKTSSILGPLIFGTMSEFFHSQRPAVLSVALLFIAGLVFLHRVAPQPTVSPQ